MGGAPTNGVEPPPRMVLSRPEWTPLKDGGGKGTRTPDPLLAKQMLSQLSYAPQTRTDDYTYRGLSPHDESVL